MDQLRARRRLKRRWKDRTKKLEPEGFQKKLEAYFLRWITWSMLLRATLPQGPLSGTTPLFPTTQLPSSKPRGL